MKQHEMWLTDEMWKPKKKKKPEGLYDEPHQLTARRRNRDWVRARAAQRPDK